MNYFFKMPLFLFFLLGPPLYLMSQDSTQNLLEDLKKVDSLFYHHFDRGIELRKKKDYEAAHVELERAESIAQQYNIPSLLTQAKLLKGRNLSRLNKYKEALLEFEEVLHNPDTTISKKDIARAQTETASIHQNLGEYSEAVLFHLKALKTFEITNDSKGKIRTFYELGRTYFQKGDNQKSLIYFEQSLALLEENWNNKRRDSTKIFHCYSAIGSVYEKLEMLDQSLEFNLKSYQLAQVLNDSSYIASALQNLGTNYTLLEKYETADYHLLQSLNLFRGIGDKWGMAGTYLYLGKLYTKWDKLSKAIKYLNDGLDVATEMGSKDRIIQFFIALADTYQKAGDFESSDRFLRNYIALRETVINESTIIEIKEAQWDYTSYKQQYKIELLEKEQEVSRLRTIGILIVLCFCLSGLFIFYRWNKKQREVNLLLAEKNQEIAKTNLELKQVNEDLRQFTSVASHDLREPLRTITTFISLLERHYGHQFEDSAKEYFKFIKDASNRMQALLEDLLAYSRIDRKQKPEEWVDSSEIVHNTLANLQFRILETNAQIQVNYEALPKIKATPSQLGQVFQNIISNGLKFQPNQQPLIQVDCVLDGKNFLFSIKDNGIGIPENKKEKIFEMFSRLHKREDYEGTGIGLPTCKKIVENHGGTIWVDSELGKGSTFYFTIPKKNVRLTKLPKERNRKLQPTG